MSESTEECFVAGSVEIDPVFLEKKLKMETFMRVEIYGQTDSKTNDKGQELSALVNLLYIDLLMFPDFDFNFI